MKKSVIKAALITAFAAVFILCAGYYLRIQSLRRDPARAFESAQARVSYPPKTANTPKPRSPKPDSGGGPEPTQRPHIQAQRGIVNILVLGIDTSGERSKMHMGFRSDTIALCAVDLNSNALSIIGVPRDTRALVQKLNKKGERVGESYDRINAAYAFGKDNAKHSHENAMRAVEDLLGVKVSYYASLDLDGIRPIADAVGGVPVTLEHDYPGVGTRGERVTLLGDAAMRYVRRRKGASGGGDLGRMKRQQEFLVSAARRIKCNGVMGIPELWLKCGGYVQTNLSLEQMIVLGEALCCMDLDNVKCVTLPGKSRTIEGKSYYIASVEGLREIVSDVYR